MSSFISNLFFISPVLIETKESNIFSAIIIINIIIIGCCPSSIAEKHQICFYAQFFRIKFLLSSVVNVIWFFRAL